jgi:tetratricopeptide (TPR) repeat protein
LYRIEGNIRGYLAEQRIALDLSKELPNSRFLHMKAHTLCLVARELNAIGKISEAIALLEESYEMQCCEKGPADLKLQVTVGELVQLYEDAGMLDKAEEFARAALDNVLTHEEDEEQRKSSEASFSFTVAIILQKIAARIKDEEGEFKEEHASARSEESLLDEAESLYKRSFDIISLEAKTPYYGERCLEPLSMLTSLMVRRKKSTPEMRPLIQREIALARSTGKDIDILATALN